MNKSKTFVFSLALSAIVIGFATKAVLAADPATRFSSSAVGTMSVREAKIVTLKANGETVAEVRLLKPSAIKITGLQVITDRKTLRTTKEGRIEITAEGQAPWSITADGLEVEISH